MSITEIWDNIGMIGLIFAIFLVIVGILATTIVFFHQVWKHINTKPAIISAEKIILKGDNSLISGVEIKGEFEIRNKEEKFSNCTAEENKNGQQKT